jgi:hypothetical protein
VLLIKNRHAVSATEFDHLDVPSLTVLRASLPGGEAWKKKQEIPKIIKVRAEKRRTATDCSTTQNHRGYTRGVS